MTRSGTVAGLGCIVMAGLILVGVYAGLPDVLGEGAWGMGYLLLIGIFLVLGIVILAVTSKPLSSYVTREEPEDREGQ